MTTKRTNPASAANGKLGGRPPVTPGEPITRQVAARISSRTYTLLLGLVQPGRPLSSVVRAILDQAASAEESK